MLANPLAQVLAVSLLLVAFAAPATAQVKEGDTLCFSCDQCSSVGITTPTATGRYCRKSVTLGETSRAAVSSCTPIPKMVYCCNTALCNAGPARPAAGVAMVMASTFAAMVTALYL
ncbi:hypothetical protein BOX15_Mlig026439g2 [Macrostomum lignano]|uniref:UPAR/Ly6 domain-containing protein n=1 Tax=Macrostomum lignano TaxID=282301 RepID=A0A267DFP4_9PLAT|nr:hypothetical protein BOX15_Mlig026439g1 [Macrostomum lignano]PAA77935.1 hypothetical protein BOX15_Mlig026439g2 [Macrostomum lignano]